MFQMKKILLTTLLVLVSLAAAAQKRGSVTATVLDDETGETVPGAVLTVAPVGAPDKKVLHVGLQRQCFDSVAGLRRIQPVGGVSRL